jgi:hypothetical protein
MLTLSIASLGVTIPPLVVLTSCGKTYNLSNYLITDVSEDGIVTNCHPTPDKLELTINKRKMTYESRIGFRFDSASQYAKYTISGLWQPSSIRGIGLKYNYPNNVEASTKIVIVITPIDSSSLSNLTLGNKPLTLNLIHLIDDKNNTIKTGVS